jgi:hypothetical protein
VNGHTVLPSEAQEQLAAVEGAGMMLLAGRLAPATNRTWRWSRTDGLSGAFLRDDLVQLGLVDGDPGQARRSGRTPPSSTRTPAPPIPATPSPGTRPRAPDSQPRRRLRRRLRETAVVLVNDDPRHRPQPGVAFTHLGSLPRRPHERDTSQAVGRRVGADNVVRWHAAARSGLIVSSVPMLPKSHHRGRGRVH